MYLRSGKTTDRAHTLPHVTTTSAIDILKIMAQETKETKSQESAIDLLRFVRQRSEFFAKTKYRNFVSEIVKQFGGFLDIDDPDVMYYKPKRGRTVTKQDLVDAIIKNV